MQQHVQAYKVTGTLLLGGSLVGSETTRIINIFDS